MSTLSGTHISEPRLFVAGNHELWMRGQGYFSAEAQVGSFQATNIGAGYRQKLFRSHWYKWRSSNFAQPLCAADSCR